MSLSRTPLQMRCVMRSMRHIVLLVLLACSTAMLLAQQVTGTFTAQGNGTPRLYMASGTVQIAGNGRLMVSHNAQITFAGTAPTATAGKLADQDVDAYNGFTGSATITGTNFSVGMPGSGITVTATGNGFALLLGLGTYTLTDANQQVTNGNWTPLRSVSHAIGDGLQQKQTPITIGQLKAVQATGTLTAQGEGSPRLRMAIGTVQIAGSGTLMISHNAQITFTGAAPTATTSNMGGQQMDTYTNFNGSAVVTGNNFSMGMDGKGITLSASGAGAAYLLGTGTCTIAIANGQATNGTWTAIPTGNAQANLTAATLQIGKFSDVYDISNYH